ncbi:MAG: S16 family serine protease [Candidatus Micrarchaeia archaeon]
MSRQALAFILFLALAIAISFPATCPTAERNIYLAAVTGENSGGVFQLHVEVKPGNGTIYTSINPKTGFSTQESEEAAANYAFSSTGIARKDCDVLYSMNGDFGTDSVDGPSAGGAMTVATRAALLNRAIRQDTVMTGTISQDGKVGEVGGIIEKGIGASDAGAKYFIIPTPKIHESILLSSISKTKDFHAIGVENLSEAEAILFSGYGSVFASNFTQESKPIPAALPPIKLDADLGRFSLIAKKVVGELQMKVFTAYPPGGENEETARLADYFSAEVMKYNSLLPLGYVFTAANSAFLLSIDVEYAKIGDSGVDLGGSIDDVATCVGAIPQIGKTKENMHWAIGSNLRRIWASERLNQTLEARSEQGGYATLRDLLFVNSWCGISGGLASQANEIGGTAANESLLAALASRELLSAKEAFSSSAKTDYDALWHLQNAQDANQSGDFGASIYESAYARVMQSASSGNVENTTSAAKALLSTPRNSLWGKIYAGHGAYLYYDAIDKGFPPDDAYKILKYSQELDRVSSEIGDELLKIPQDGAPAQEQGGEQTPVPCAPYPLPEQLLIIAFSLALIAFSLYSIRRFSARAKGGW